MEEDEEGGGLTVLDIEEDYDKILQGLSLDELESAH